MHLSCSDPFTGGYGSVDGPSDPADEQWQIAYFSITRFKSGDFFRNCGNVVNPFPVSNTADTSGDDSFGGSADSSTDTVEIGPGITIDRLSTNGKRMTVRLSNLTGDTQEIANVTLLDWPSDNNGSLTKVRLGDQTLWTGNLSGPPAVLDVDGPGNWAGGTLGTGDDILRFDFKNKVAKAGNGLYTVRVNFVDGTFLDIRA